MKTAHIISLLAASAAAVPATFQRRDGPDGGPAGGIDISSILQNLDLSKIGDLMKGVDMSKIGDLMKGIDMSKIGDLVKNIPPSQIASLASNPDIMKAFGSFYDQSGAATKAKSVESIAPILRPTAKRVKIVYGPYTIKGSDNKGKVGNGFSLDPSGTGWTWSPGSDFPRDITIIDVKSGVFDSNYVPIDIGKGLYNHHNVFFDQSQSVTPITSCPNGKASFAVPMSIFMGGATESSTIPYTSMNGQFNSGYYLGPNAKVVSMLDVVNYHKEDQQVYVISEMEYVPGKIADALPATSQVIDIGSCSDSGQGFSVHPPSPDVKQWTINSSNINIATDGYFLAGKAHFHDGGVDMKVWLNGDEVCRSVAQYGGPGREGTNPDGTAWSGLAGTTFCDKVIPVKKGDVLRFSADFDVAKHPERQFEEGEHSESKPAAGMSAMPGMGGMGGMGGESGMAEGMALYTVSFAQMVPGAKTDYAVAAV